MFLDKYKPKSSKEILGNKLAANEIANFLKTWKKGQALMIGGNTGTGKTTAVRLIGYELGYEIIEIGADEERKIADMKYLIKASKQNSLMAKKKMIVIDELDQIESAKWISEIINESDHPVILITTDIYERKLLAIRQKCKIVKFQKIRYDSIARFLNDMCLNEKIEQKAAYIDQIAKMSNGDIRAALIDLEVLCAGQMSARELGYRERPNDIFETLKIIFKTSSIENAMIALNNAEDPEDLHRWVAENIANEYENPDDIAKAYDRISMADIMHARILRRQSWNLQRYFFELSCAGVALSKKTQYNKFVRYSRPKFRPRKSSEAAEKISLQLHVSKRNSQIYWPLIKKMSKNKKMLDELGLTKEDLKQI